MSAEKTSLGHKADVLSRICSALEKAELDRAEQIATSEYAFTPRSRSRRSYTPYQCMSVFNRDGFIDRYTGARLVFPGALRILGLLLPEHFPWHPHGKLSESHIVYWELWPTIDHLVPVSRGGLDEETNWITTSMLKNQAKLHWTLDELGWRLHPPGRLSDWDGLTAWGVRFVENRPELLRNSVIKRWHSAAVRAGREISEISLRKDAGSIPGD